MINCDPLEDLNYKFSTRKKPRSAYIPDGTWDRTNRVASILHTIDRQPVWAMNDALKQLSNDSGYLEITCDAIGEVLGLTKTTARNHIKTLVEMGLWISHYDKRSHILEMQSNPTITQKYNDARLELTAILTWRRLAQLSGQPFDGFEFGLVKAENYANVRSKIEALKQQMPLPKLGKDEEMLVAYVAEVFHKHQQDMQEMKEMLAMVLAEVRKDNPEKANEIQLTLIQGGKASEHMLH